MSADRQQQHLGVYTTDGFKSGLTVADARRFRFTVLRGAVHYRQHGAKMRNIRKSIGLK